MISIHRNDFVTIVSRPGMVFGLIAVLVLVVVTCAAGPILTERWGKRITPEDQTREIDPDLSVAQA